MDYEITPYVGAGPLKLGMVRAQVHTALSGKPVSRGNSEYYTALGIQVEYENEKAIFFQFSGPQTVKLDEFSPIGQPADTAIQDLVSMDPSTEVSGSDVTSYTLGVGYYILNQKVACAAIFVKGYYGGPTKDDEPDEDPERVLAVKWDEGQHPRATDGRFGSAAGQHAGKKPEGETEHSSGSSSSVKPMPDLSKLPGADSQTVEYMSNQWSTRNMQENNLSLTERQGAYTYTRDDTVNGALRQGHDLSPRQKAIQKNLDSAIAKSTVPEGGITVYRGTRMRNLPPGLAETGLTPGTTFQDKGFSSTSLKKGIGEHFARNEPDSAVMIISVKQGEHALPIGNNRMAKFTKECEVVLPRDTRYTIDRVEKKWINGKFRTYMHVTAETPK